MGGGGNDTLLGSTGMTPSLVISGMTFSALSKHPSPQTGSHYGFCQCSGNNDTFQMENAVFTKLGAGAAHPLDPEFFRSNTTGLAQDANDHVIYNRSTGALYYDSNGKAAGGSVQIATLTNRTALTAADFTVI